MWSLTILAVILFLDKCTSLNVFNALNTVDYTRFPDLKNGARSKNYEIRRISKDSYKNIRYDPVGNYFLIEGNFEISKIDAYGTEVFKLDNKANKEMYFPRFTSYVFDSTGVYDLSAAKIKKQLFSKMINLKQELTDEAWQRIFDAYYKRADVVVFASTDMYKKGNPIFIRVNSEWILLITTEHETRIEETEYIAGIRFKGYTAKHNHLYLLKDVERQSYSDFEGTTEDFLQSFNGINLAERNMRYPAGREIKRIAFKKIGVDGEIAYTPIPVSWHCTTAQSITIDKEELKFKAVGIKALSLFTKIDSRIWWYSVPEKYLNKTSVTFMIYSFPSNVKAGEANNGLYIVRKIKQ
jgi:hypothetical protein